MRNRPKGTVVVFRSDTLGTCCPLWVAVSRRGMRRAVRRLRRFGAPHHPEQSAYSMSLFVFPWTGNRHALPVTRTGKTITV
jgi:hypothetical protein